MEDLSRIKVIVENLSDGTVGYRDENRRVRRRWNAMGQKLVISAEELEEVLYDESIKRLFTLGYLGIKDAGHRELVGLDIQDYQTVKPFTSEDAIKLLGTTMSEIDFKKTITALEGNAKDVLVRAASTLDTVSQIKIKAIKEELGIDISKIIENQG